MKNQLCPCQSGKAFRQCCEPYLEGKAKPKTVKQLMRSRYSAYALGGHGEYLMNSWHPNYRAGIHGATLEAKSQDWTGLTILGADQDGDLGRVEFKATYNDDSGNEETHHELSSFVRVGGRWHYTEGTIFDTDV